MPSRLGRESFHRSTSGGQAIELLLEWRDFARSQIEPALVGRKNGVADFPSSPGELLFATPFGRDRIEVGKAIRFRHVPDALPMVVPPTALRARSANPRGVAGSFERGHFACRIHCLEHSPLVVATECVYQRMRPGIVPAEQVEVARSGVGGKWLEPGDVPCSQRN